jgi:putative ABC transport system permease protein
MDQCAQRPVPALETGCHVKAKGEKIMFDTEKAIRKWRKDCHRNPSLEDGYIEELEAHLREEIARARREGLSDEAAFQRAVEDVGSIDGIGAEYYKTDTRGISGRPVWSHTRLSPALLFHYAKLAFRKMRKQKGYSVINLAGLAIGMACCIMILLWIVDELSYDRFHKNAGNIVRTIAKDMRESQMRMYLDTPSLLGPTLKEDYPEVVEFCRMQCGWTNYWLHYQDKNFIDHRLCTADPSFFKIFKFPFIYGDPETALDDRYSVVLTETLAKKCFGDIDPLGKVMKLNDQDMTVTGVIEDIPTHSHLQFDYCFPAVNMERFRESRFDTWEYAQFATYLELAEGTDVKEFSKKIRFIAKEHLPKIKGEIGLQRLTDVHLRSEGIETWTVPYPNPGNITNVYVFGLVALSILLLACINFMNLVTARSSQRAKEVGLRKVIGARRRDLVRQFYGEAVVMTLIALAAAIALVQAFLPSFNLLSRKQISLSFDHLPLLLGLLGIAALTGLLAGSYPALFLSSFQPSAILKDTQSSGRRRSGALRKTLVVFQFAVTTVLLILTVVFYSQLHYIQKKDLGFDSENIIALASYGKFGEQYDAVRPELMQNPDILNICRAFPPSQGFGRTSDVDWEGKDPNLEAIFGSDMGDYDYLDTFGMTMAEGRYYSREFSTDKDNFVINETAAKLMGSGSVLGKRFRYRDKSGTIIGVVKDYYGASLREPISPKVIELRDGFFVCFRFRGAVNDMVGYLENKWEEYVENFPFSYNFIDERIAAYYDADRRASQIIRNFTILALFVACLGLFGLAAFTAEQRTKEIGIRKVLGARPSVLTGMLVKDFAKWVFIANLIAWPLAYYLASRWLSSFAYRAGLGWPLFILILLLTLAVAMATAGFQALRAAASDPVKSLRYE